MYVDTFPDSKRKYLSDAHAETVKATLAPVADNMQTIATTFYSKMFAAHPELISDLFNRGNQKQNAQQKALAASVVKFAAHLVDDSQPDPVMMLDRIAHKHVSLGITEDQYQIVHDNLMAAIAETLGEAVTPEVAEAWDAVYWLMADVLIKHEKELYASDGVADGDVFRRGTVTAKEALSETVTAFTVEGDFSAPKPGQYTSIGVKLDDGARQLRQYSIIDGDASHYRIAVQKDGEVSSYLQERVAVGDTVDATLAAGDLVLRPGENPIVLISSGIGSTPLTGILTHLVKHDDPRRVTYVHSDSSEATWAQAQESRDLVAALNDGSIHPFFRDSGERIDIHNIDVAGADVYLCGGTGFLQSLRDDLAALPEDKAPANVFYELFSPNDWLVS
ncbi:hemin transporter [Corynebacterium sp. HMSC05C01]|uniref:globin domain-containing protein n=1 Tax=Corynebacterium TaxID=1716 RepID=UPI0008A2B671|nr:MULTISPECIES: globin domain-containing protein [Corynebacterium]MDK8242407.1 globin domain-containing protein [Corynebacterium coyleae]MDK8822950.1 globin domain-containing protein [Corynebacterium coyleae]OFT71305.1 hemin transporter [Corynebacterium sp. HMSC05C01]OFU53759.1 hemin transporter [Corynebacterium sp. HMSC11D10]OHO35334.1 hemin transporter [Corynebacterium sp. HMSC034E11]